MTANLFYEVLHALPPRVLSPEGRQVYPFQLVFGSVPADLQADPTIEETLGKIGAIVETIVDSPKYRLAGAAYRLSVSAFCKAAVYSGQYPKPGVTFYTTFYGGPNGDEPQLSDNNGNVQFNGSAPWAFSVPGGGPIRIGIAEHAVKTDEQPRTIIITNPLSQRVAMGDWRGEHTEIYLMWVETGAELPPPPPPPDPTPSPFDPQVLIRAAQILRDLSEDLTNVDYHVLELASLVDPTTPRTSARR